MLGQFYMIGFIFFIGYLTGAFATAIILEFKKGDENGQCQNESCDGIGNK